MRRVFLVFILAIILIFVAFKFFNNAVPPEYRTYGQDWPTANQNLANTRATTNSSISSKTIDKLGLAWSLPFEGKSDWGAAATNPIILGNTVYVQDLKSNIYSVDLITGQKNWIKIYNLGNIGPTGVAVGYNKIFAPKGNYEVAALDLSGNEVWSTKISTNENVGVDIQPVVFNNLVYISTVPGISNKNFYKGGSVGTLYALDVNTGKVKWSFDTVDSKDIWGNPKENSGGGAWYPPAIDTQSNITFWGIGNPAPWPGTKDFPNGSSRPGPNLYTNSVVALKATNGRLQWFNQARAHDLFDYDLEASPVLANVQIKGIPTDIVIAAGKMGRVFVFNRKSGEKIWETPVGMHLNDTLTALPSGQTPVSPGPLGGVETNLAYANGVIYVPVVNMVTSYTPTSLVTETFDLSKGRGELVALDAATGKVIWDNDLKTINVGAATVVNDLVFTSTYDGKIYAFNTKDGKKVWEYQAPGGINGWPAVKGDTIIFPVGVGKSPQLLALKIGGKALPTGESLPKTGPGKEFQQ